jgi:hypothetical protein
MMTFMFRSFNSRKQLSCPMVIRVCNPRANFFVDVMKRKFPPVRSTEYTTLDFKNSCAIFRYFASPVAWPIGYEL